MSSVKTWAAFDRIAHILKLSCEHGTGFNITAPASTLPSTMAPTLQQQMVPHPPYIDMLPWPSMRDRMLSSIGAINDEEFILDLAQSKVWGSMPWDPLSWEVEAHFAKKWWFLMDDSILHTTNFWRGQKGEEGLVLPRM
jgi:hypothetical protein